VYSECMWQDLAAFLDSDSSDTIITLGMGIVVVAAYILPAKMARWYCDRRQCTPGQFTTLVYINYALAFILLCLPLFVIPSNGFAALFVVFVFIPAGLVSLIPIGMYVRRAAKKYEHGAYGALGTEVTGKGRGGHRIVTTVFIAIGICVALIWSALFIMGTVLE